MTHRLILTNKCMCVLCETTTTTRFDANIGESMRDWGGTPYYEYGKSYCHVRFLLVQARLPPPLSPGAMVNMVDGNFAGDGFPTERNVVQALLDSCHDVT